jgi:hypothetical protein
MSCELPERTIDIGNLTLNRSGFYDVAVLLHLHGNDVSRQIVWPLVDHLVGVLCKNNP